MSTTAEQHPALQNAQLLSFIATRDRKIAAKQPWNPAVMRSYLEQLCAKGKVIVGGRASCGSSVDLTWTTFCAWNEVVRKARKLGFAITEVPIKHKNAWATKAGGFWNENEYTLAG